MKTNYRNIVFCTALAALMVSIMVVPVGFAAIGVEEGDWAKYNTEVIAEIADERVKETGHMKLKVENISDTIVTLEMTTYNGMEETEMINGIEMGFIIEANLTKGDKVIAPTFEAGMTLVKPLRINGSVLKEYAGVSREVNYVDYADIEIQMNGESMDLDLYKAYWDKATGFLCEISMSASGEIEGENFEMSFSVKMTENNRWGAESFMTQWWFWPIIALIIIIAAGSAVILLRGRKAKPSPTK